MHTCVLCEHNAQTIKLLLLTCPQKNKLCIYHLDPLLVGAFPSETLSSVSMTIHLQLPVIEMKQNYSNLVSSGLQRIARGHCYDQI